jgi:hypothetical protein
VTAFRPSYFVGHFRKLYQGACSRP